MVECTRVVLGHLSTCRILWLHQQDTSCIIPTETPPTWPLVLPQPSVPASPRLLACTTNVFSSSKIMLFGNVL